MNSKPAITASIGVPSRATRECANSGDARGRSRATTSVPPYRMRRLRSEDSATGETEGEHTEPRVICGLAHATIRGLGLHVCSAYADEGHPPRREFPEFL